MGPVGEFPYRSPHLGPAALAQAVVHFVASVTYSSLWLTVAQKVNRIKNLVFRCNETATKVLEESMELELLSSPTSEEPTTTYVALREPLLENS